MPVKLPLATVNKSVSPTHQTILGYILQSVTNEKINWYQKKKRHFKLTQLSQVQSRAYMTFLNSSWELHESCLGFFLVVGGGGGGRECPVQWKGFLSLAVVFLSRVAGSPEQVHCSGKRQMREGNRKFLRDQWLLACQLPTNRHSNTDLIFPKPGKGSGGPIWCWLYWLQIPKQLGTFGEQSFSRLSCKFSWVRLLNYVLWLGPGGCC